MGYGRTFSDFNTRQQAQDYLFVFNSTASIYEGPVPSCSERHSCLLKTLHGGGAGREMARRLRALVSLGPEFGSQHPQ